MLDTARHFLPVKDILRTIDAMKLTKLNILHLHLTDSESFPFFSKSYPNITKNGAYSDKEIYST